MNNGSSDYPLPVNEPVFSYAPGSAERLALQKQLNSFKSGQADIPMFIGGREVRTGNQVNIHPPHEISRSLGIFHQGGQKEVKLAIEAALAARESWAELKWEERAAIFLKAADLISGTYRFAMNAATMLGQSKNAYQAEIDSACELIDFLRFNIHFLSQIYQQQPLSSAGVHNRMEYRPLEGFVLAITPFNFTAIGGNLPTSAALCGNVVVWKPAEAQIFAAWQFMQILTEAGLPAGVINLVYSRGPELGEACFSHPEFAGIHFTGSTGVFRQIWQTIGEHIHTYRSFPRIVGETGGKDFVVVHPSADPDAVVANLIRGAFEYQGQKCSAASRAYIPSNLAAGIREKLVRELEGIEPGPVEDFSCFMNAVISEQAFDKISGFINQALRDPEISCWTGGTFDKTKGYFIRPTVLETRNPEHAALCDELFGPVLSVFLYEENRFEEILGLVDRTSPYGLTGAVFARDRSALQKALVRLRQSAGNFYINDKPTGAVVGQQPFGGARGSGTNDKAGSMINLYRWLSPRTIKETLVPVRDYRYPFLGKD